MQIRSTDLWNELNLYNSLNGSIAVTFRLTYNDVRHFLLIREYANKYSSINLNSSFFLLECSKFLDFVWRHIALLCICIRFRELSASNVSQMYMFVLILFQFRSVPRNKLFIVTFQLSRKDLFINCIFWQTDGKKRFLCRISNHCLG